MKLFIAALLTLSPLNALAYGSIVFPLSDKSSVEIEWLGSEADDSEVELAWENGGQTLLYNGDICFKGLRKEAIQVLEYLELKEFMGDEFSIQNIHYVGRDKISYEIFDGPNGEISNELTISACR